MGNLVRAFRAFGDPARQRLLTLLERDGELCVSALARHFEMTQPSISHHLRVLKEARLVTARKCGKEVYYALNPTEMRRCCGAFFAKFECCRPVLVTAVATATEPGRRGG